MHEQKNHDYRFAVGLALGSVAGVGLAMLLAPKATAEVKARARDSAKALTNAVSGRYREARLGVERAVDGLARTSRDVRDEAYNTVLRGAQRVEVGAQEVQRYASDAKTHAT